MFLTKNVFRFSSTKELPSKSDDAEVENNINWTPLLSKQDGGKLASVKLRSTSPFMHSKPLFGHKFAYLNQSQNSKQPSIQPHPVITGTKRL